MPRFHSNPASVGRAPAGKPTELFAASWETRRRQLRLAWRRCRHHPSVKNVRNLRIIIRRLFAHLDLLRPALPAGIRKRTRRELKQLMHATAPTRDAQVQVHLFEQIADLSHHPGARRIHRHLKKRSRHRVRKLPAEMSSPHAVLRRIRPGNLIPSLPAADRWFRTLAGHTLRHAFRRMKTRLQAARADDPAARHRARVALKQFRYLAEVIASTTNDRHSAELKHLHAVQSAMGDLHDFDLLLQRLEKYPSRHQEAADWLQSQRAALLRRRRALWQAQARPQFDLTSLSPVSRSKGRKRSCAAGVS